MNVNLELILKALDVAEKDEVRPIHDIICKYRKAIHLKKEKDASMLELAIERFICYHTENYAIQK
jgi:hypothetical protein